MSSFEYIKNERNIVEWCKKYIANILNSPDMSIDEDQDFSELGLDSSLAVSLLIEIEQLFGVEISTEELFDNPNIAAVAKLVINSQR